MRGGHDKSQSRVRCLHQFLRRDSALAASRLVMFSMVINYYSTTERNVSPRPAAYAETDRVGSQKRHVVKQRRNPANREVDVFHMSGSKSGA